MLAVDQKADLYPAWLAVALVGIWLERGRYVCPGTQTRQSLNSLAIAPTDWRVHSCCRASLRDYDISSQPRRSPSARALMPAKYRTNDAPILLRNIPPPTRIAALYEQSPEQSSFPSLKCIIWLESWMTATSAKVSVPTCVHPQVEKAHTHPLTINAPNCPWTTKKQQTLNDSMLSSNTVYRADLLMIKHANAWTLPFYALLMHPSNMDGRSRVRKSTTHQQTSVDFLLLIDVNHKCTGQSLVPSPKKPSLDANRIEMRLNRVATVAASYYSPYNYPRHKTLDVGLLHVGYDWLIHNLGVVSSQKLSALGGSGMNWETTSQMTTHIVSTIDSSFLSCEST